MARAAATSVPAPWMGETENIGMRFFIGVCVWNTSSRNLGGYYIPWRNDARVVYFRGIVSRLP